MDRSETGAEPVISLPPNLRAELEGPAQARGPWYHTIGPAYLGIFVWAPFFDSLWIGDLGRFPLPWLLASAVVASLLCFVFLYWAPASWGFQTGRSLGIVAASTFGTVGSEWITGILVGIAGVVWYAVAIDYAVDSTLLGLRASGLITPESLRPWNLGPIVIKCPVYLTTAIFWIYITGTAGLWKIPGVIVALMKVYAPIALLLLTAVALAMSPLVGFYRLDDAAAIAAAAGFAASWRGPTSVVAIITGFFAMAGLVSADWGAMALRRRDLVVGGLTTIVLAASWTALMSLAIVAAAVAWVSDRRARAVTGVDDPLPLSFRWAVYHGIGGIPAGVILILFGLAALAPACYSVWVFGRKLSTHWPRLGQSGWTWTGGAIALALGATSQVNRLDWIFCGMGDVFAPAVGAIAGDWVRQRGSWAGLRPGVNRVGLIAWGAGLGLALVLEADAIASHEPSPWWQSSSICGFAGSFVVYSVLARLGRERSAVAPSRHEITGFREQQVERGRS